MNNPAGFDGYIRLVFFPLRPKVDISETLINYNCLGYRRKCLSILPNTKTIFVCYLYYHINYLFKTFQIALNVHFSARSKEGKIT